MQVPEYIERRIRRPIPPDSHVVAGSTPVVSFGNAQSVSIATLGLNPSRVEFLDRKGNELVGSSRRLATYASLGSSDLCSAPVSTIEQVWKDCNLYFKDDRNPYRKWFDQLELILRACGASYYNDSACHLDLVQWATDPTWANLRPSSLRNRLLVADLPFLIEQLSNENIQLLLVNGMAVVRQLQSKANADLRELEPISGFSHCDTRFFEGTLLERIRIIGWSTNLQSSFGVTTELRAQIARRAGNLV